MDVNNSKLKNIMLLDNSLLNEAKKMLDVMDGKADEILPESLVDIVKFHTKGATASALASAWIPGAGGTIATISAAGFIWSMYIRINEKIGMPFSENVIKTIASGVATNLASVAAGNIIFSSLASFLPGLGTVGASVVVGITCYAMTLCSGYLYFKLMTKLIQDGIDLSNASVENIKSASEIIAKSNDVKDFLKKAKKEFMEKKKSGDFDQKGQ